MTQTHEVCWWCIKFSHDITNGSGNYDECVEGCVTMSETEGWTDKDNKDNFHACLTLEYDMGADKPWVDRCDCTGLHFESSKDFWGRVGLE